MVEMYLLSVLKSASTRLLNLLKLLSSPADDLKQEQSGLCMFRAAVCIKRTRGTIDSMFTLLFYFTIYNTSQRQREVFRLLKGTFYVFSLVSL